MMLSGVISYEADAGRLHQKAHLAVR